MKSGRVLLVLLGLFCIVPARIGAHPLDNSYAEFRVATNVVTATFTFKLECLGPFSTGPAASSRAATRWRSASRNSTIT